jgi:hypothetical protein
MINDHASKFYGLPVVEFEPQPGIENPRNQVYRLAFNYDDESGFQKMLDKFFNSPKIAEIPALIIGNWSYDPVETDPEFMLLQLIEQCNKLPNLKALFIGDITSEECEISWIEQTNYAPLLQAFPQLEQLRVRGSNGLGFSKLEHNNLKTLIIESGGLPKTVIQSIIDAKLPALEHLELWLGVDEYGFDGDIETIKPLLETGRFPKLRYLGLRDSEIVDEIAIEIATASILNQLNVLDISLGILTDKGAQALLNSERIKSLKKLDLRHHYMSTSMMEKLKQLDIEVDVSEQQQDEDDDGEIYRYVAVSE